LAFFFSSPFLTGGGNLMLSTICLSNFALYLPFTKCCPLTDGHPLLQGDLNNNENGSISIVFFQFFSHCLLKA